MAVTWKKDGLSTDPPATTMNYNDVRSFGVTFPAPANIATATAVLRKLADDTTTTIPGGSLTVATSSVTALINGDTLVMVRGQVYRLEVQAVRSTAIEETARLVIECPE